MRTIASMTAVRSLAGSCAQTCGLATVCMVGPPGCGYSLEGRHQFCNGSRGQNGRFTARFGGEIGAADGNVRHLIGAEFDLAMTDVSRQRGEAHQLQGPAV
jgi:hypothetical protein